jgi:hypothetical protein
MEGGSNDFARNSARSGFDPRSCGSAQPAPTCELAADLLRDYLIFHGVQTNPDGSLNIGATLYAATHDLWKHYFTARDGADRELTIAYLELLLSRMMRLLPNSTGQQLAFAELLRQRGERVVLQRATSTTGVALTDRPEPGAHAAQSSGAPIAPVINLIGPSDEALMRENQRLECEVRRLEALLACEQAKQTAGAGSAG